MNILHLICYLDGRIIPEKREQRKSLSNAGSSQTDSMSTRLTHPSERTRRRIEAAVKHGPEEQLASGVQAGNSMFAPAEIRWRKFPVQIFLGSVRGG
ncbi:hypothetical protein T03_15964 [Trichinella britovi]|uniref:Uncharacterized protein n=1 Tax=Trichinella britovi TaxID=45882 RepID=A0A0V1BG48_TRIBR|nr:hypothetical protein T03_15964 [Trichinella britovi]